MDVHAIRAALKPLGLCLRHFDNGPTRHDVLNIAGNSRELVRADVDTFRVLLTERGLTEVKSWVAGEGISWLSDGILSVSFEIYDPEKPTA